MLACILEGPRIEQRRTHERRNRWCFRCRKSLRQCWVLLNYPEDSPHWGWYEPIWVRQCSGCGEDHTEFPEHGEFM